MRLRVGHSAECKGGQSRSPTPPPPVLPGVWTAAFVDTNLKRTASIIQMLSPPPPTYPPFPPPPSLRPLPTPSPPASPLPPPWCVRLSVALCASEHDPLGVSAAPLRPQRWQLANGRRLHQQPARQVEVVPLSLPHLPAPPTT